MRRWVAFLWHGKDLEREHRDHDPLRYLREGQLKSVPGRCKLRHGCMVERNVNVRDCADDTGSRICRRTRAKLSCQELASRFVVLMDHAHGGDKLAEMELEFLRQETIEEGRA
jgi:hypothetical protein